MPMYLIYEGFTVATVAEIITHSFNKLAGGVEDLANKPSLQYAIIENLARYHVNIPKDSIASVVTDIIERTPHVSEKR